MEKECNYKNSHSETLEISEKEFNEILEIVKKEVLLSKCPMDALKIIFPEMNKYQKAKIIIYNMACYEKIRKEELFAEVMNKIIRGK